eukprot:TRINITY_DN10100_c0_g1_i1.p1 TRINITY_DN10100_c0_g1~~TRINITY_DN10100_c0_g1_i1.p1  ORF type:complete len:556 (-),score=154.75 TRINITY_DN10100_c0_g1_i1:222-1889(-)
MAGFVSSSSSDRIFWRIFSLLIAVGTAAGLSGEYTCFYNSVQKAYRLQKGVDHTGAAWGKFEDDIERTGYGILSVFTNSTYPDAFQVGCAGYLEGALTSTRISQLYTNFWNSTFGTQYPQKVVAYTQATIAWTTKQANANAGDRYWDQVQLVLAQLDGLVGGQNDYAAAADTKLEFWQLYLLNMLGDLDDLIPALQRQEHVAQGVPVPDLADENHVDWVRFHSHCSSIVKPTPDFQELFAAHEMWSSYFQMLNVYKHYQFGLAGVVSKVSFSSYPGLLSSEDDFYVLSSGLVVMETTNGVYNMSLYDSIQPESLVSWVRVIVSNRLATSGADWVQVMARYNSGTYNNQWIVVDYKLFVAGSKVLANNTLWIGSQMPGIFESADVTSVINSQGYWPSYNVPYFEDIWKISGYAAMYEKYGDFFSYAECPRAKIFRQRQASAVDVASMQHLVRYNDWQHDPLSLGCPGNQLAARFDLSPSNTGNCSAGAFGAINGKIASAEMTPRLAASIVAGPTHDSLPPFAWTAENERRFSNTLHVGQPRVFDFSWFETSPPTSL